MEDARSQSYRVYGTDGNVAALAARDYKWPKLVPAPITRIGHSKCYRRSYQIFDPCGPVEAIDTGQGGGRNPYVGIKVIGSTHPHRHSTGDIHGADGIMSTCTGRDYKQPKQVAVPLAFGIDKNVNGKEREIANTLTAREDRGVSNHHREGTAIAIPVITPDRSVKRQNGRRFKENGDPAFILTAQDRHGVAIGMDAPKQGDGMFFETEQGFTVYAVWYEKYSCYIAIRKLTPKECFRLQGWEDKYFNRAKWFNSDSQLYKQAGNAVTINVVQLVGERIK